MIMVMTGLAIADRRESLSWKTSPLLIKRPVRCRAKGMIAAAVKNQQRLVQMGFIVAPPVVQLPIHTGRIGGAQQPITSN